MSMLGAKEVAEHACLVSEDKVNKPSLHVLVSSIIAGMFIGFGYYGFLVLASGTTDPMLGRFLGAFIFPVGIILIVLTGTDLFTGNCLITIGYFKKQFGVIKVGKNLGLVLIGNFIGASLLILFVYYSNMLGNFDDSPTNTLVYIQKLATQKVHLTFSEAVFRGILANVLVSLAVYASFAAKTVGGKVIVLLLPVTLFVISGFEHNVANMFILPLAYVTGGEFTLTQLFIGNLLPVTIGNFISGGLLIPLGFYFLYVRQYK